MIEMGYQNPYALGNEAMGCNCSYNCSSHGSASATYESTANADLPSYAHGFYSQTEFEVISEIRYSKTEIGYDRSLREIKRAIDGAPLEAYIPRSHFVDDTGSAVPRTGEVIEPIVIKRPDQKIVDEIIKAQRLVSGKEIILREIEIEEIIIKRRRIRKKEIVLRKNNKEKIISSDKEEI